MSESDAQDDVSLLAAELGAESTGPISGFPDAPPPPSAPTVSQLIGEGAYEGLEFHYYFADLETAEDGPLRVHGWISSAP